MAVEAVIDKLVAQYFQLVDICDLELPDAQTIIKPAVQLAIYERMFNEASLWPIPPLGYRSRVLKLIISRIEESVQNPEEDEILDDLIHCWSELVAQPKPSSLQQAQELAYIKYTAPGSPSASVTAGSEPCETLREVITSESRGLILSSGTTGYRTWEAALHLGTYLSATPEGDAMVRGKRIIELGAGTGFLSLLCAKHLGALSVVTTDREPALLDNITDCLRPNGLDVEKSTKATTTKGRLHPIVWDWGTPLQNYETSIEEGKGQERKEFDVALGADLIYDVDLVPLLVSTVRDLFDNYGIDKFIISATLRNRDTFQTFLNACGKSCQRPPAADTSIDTVGENICAKLRACYERRKKEYDADAILESSHLSVQCLPFESPPSEAQTGFFHSTSIPIRTYSVSRSG